MLRLWPFDVFVTYVWAIEIKRLEVVNVSLVVWPLDRFTSVAGARNTCSALVVDVCIYRRWDNVCSLRFCNPELDLCFHLLFRCLWCVSSTAYTGARDVERFLSFPVDQYCIQNSHYVHDQCILLDANGATRSVSPQHQLFVGLFICILWIIGVHP